MATTYIFQLKFSSICLKQLMEKSVESAMKHLAVAFWTRRIHICTAAAFHVTSSATCVAPQLTIIISIISLRQLQTVAESERLQLRFSAAVRLSAERVMENHPACNAAGMRDDNKKQMVYRRPSAFLFFSQLVSPIQRIFCITSFTIDFRNV